MHLVASCLREAESEEGEGKTTSTIAPVAMRGRATTGDARSNTGGDFVVEGTIRRYVTTAVATQTACRVRPVTSTTLTTAPAAPPASTVRSPAASAGAGTAPSTVTESTTGCMLGLDVRCTKACQQVVRCSRGAESSAGRDGQTLPAAAPRGGRTCKARVCLPAVSLDCLTSTLEGRCLCPATLAVRTATTS